jgi:hypothetical protein
MVLEEGTSDRRRVIAKPPGGRFDGGVIGVQSRRGDFLETERYTKHAGRSRRPPFPSAGKPHSQGLTFYQRLAK